MIPSKPNECVIEITLSMTLAVEFAVYWWTGALVQVLCGGEAYTRMAVQWIYQDVLRVHSFPSKT